MCVLIEIEREREDEDKVQGAEEEKRILLRNKRLSNFSFLIVCPFGAIIFLQMSTDAEIMKQLVGCCFIFLVFIWLSAVYQGRKVSDVFGSD